ncbi:ion channel [Hyphococcus sp.]|jgi:ABC-type amino acid transport system permease subunit|uniref:ion channel n=1 Tax=Hyphococcus sp. TaxID=2038636 RepID=UPI003D0D460D
MESAGIFHQLLINAAVISATTFVHGVFVAAAAAVFRVLKTRTRGAVRFLRDTAVLVLLVLWLMFAHTLEIGMWASVFHYFGMFETWETALYFSGASFTTLGFGDVLLPEEWRLLSGAAASNGLLLFGLSAAFLFDVVGKLHLGGRAN